VMVRRNRGRTRDHVPLLTLAALAFSIALYEQPWPRRSQQVGFAQLFWDRVHGCYNRRLNLKERETLRMGATCLPIRLPRDGQSLGPEDGNIAVEDLDRLASEPLRLRLDRTGKTLRTGERAESSVPWSSMDAHGLSSAAAPLSWEEFASRYQNVDGPTLMRLGGKGGELVKEIQRLVAAENGRDDYRTVRTFSWQAEDGGSPSAVMLVGVTETSARSRQLAGRAVYETEPSALLVQLCRERIGRHLVMPAEHLMAAAHYARGYATSNPQGLGKEEYMFDAVNGDYEALKVWMSDLAYSAAVDEFCQVPSHHGTLPKVLCLGDALSSKLELLRKKQGNQTLQAVPVLSARGRQLARGLLALCALGHRTVLGIVSVDLLPPVATWLERAGARFVAASDTSDIEAGRESLAADAQLGLDENIQQRRQPAMSADEALGLGQTRMGAFINERGLAALMRRRQRLAKLTRLRDLVRHRDAPKVWHVAELLGGEPCAHVPGPRALQRPTRGLGFEFGLLEIPEAYLREAGAGPFASALWQSLCADGSALETRDPMELEWWFAE